MHPRPRPRLLLAGVLLALATAVLGAPTASAATYPSLSGQVTDQAAVVGGARSQLEAALASLLDRHGVQLYVVFLATTGTETASTYAQGTFTQNGLGGNDFLLVVAVDDHRYGWWESGAAAALTTDAIDQLASQTLEPRFRAGDYAGGVIDLAAALGAALEATPGPLVTPVPSGGGTTTGSSGFGGFLMLLLGLVLVVAGVVVVALALRRWRQQHLSEEERDRRTGELAREANARLIAADDAVREASQELDFAEAQFEEAEVAPLRDALASAREDLRAAFSVRQQLDDAVPEDPETRLKMLGQIVERGKRIEERLGAERQRLQGLREEDQKAPEVIAALPGRIAALEARLPETERTMAHLAAYAEPAWQAVRGNIEEARKRLADSTAETGRGRAALAATPPEPRAAARSARRVVGALAEAGTLLDAVARTAATLDEARAKLDAEIGAAAADVESARTAVEAPSAPQGQLAAGLAEAQTLLARARQEAAAERPDVLTALHDAQEANRRADAVLAGIREAAAQRAREAAALAAAVQAAEAAVARAGDFVATRRSGVGREARTRLAEAERHLADARGLVGSDPARAAAEAATAQRMADEAYDLARSDFDSWDRRGGGRSGPDLGTLILGGILLGNILGGGRRGGGWGGTPWGMPGGGRGWGGGGFGGGGFGGRGGGGGWAPRGGRGGGGSW